MCDSNAGVMLSADLRVRHAAIAVPTSRTSSPCRRKAMDVTAPAGPLPTTATSNLAAVLIPRRA